MHNPEIFHTKITVQYGLLTRCERQVVTVPGLPDSSRMTYTDYKCRAFPARVSDSCEKENHLFCAVWSTAGYFTELSIGLAAVACLTLVFGVSTHSRRRRIWRAVAVLVALHGMSRHTTQLGPSLRARVLTIMYSHLPDHHVCPDH